MIQTERCCSPNSLFVFYNLNPLCQFMVSTDVTSAETHPRESFLPAVHPRVTWLSLSYLLTIVSPAGTDPWKSDQLEWQPSSSAETTKLTQTKKKAGVPGVRKHGSIHSLTFQLRLTLWGKCRSGSYSAAIRGKVRVWRDPDGQPGAPQAGGSSLLM